MGWLHFFRPAPYIDEIQDVKIVSERYRYWRMRTFLAMYAGYAFFYLTRKSLTFAMPALKQDLGLSLYQLGLLGTVLSLVYGVSKFLSGIIGDKSNPRYFMAIGLMATGVCNLLCGASSLFWVLLLFWGINGWFQGWGWPGCAKLLTHWYSHSERGRWWSAWNTSHNLGGTAIPMIAALCAEYLGWRYALFIPGTVCLGVGVMLLFLLRDTPQSLGLPAIEVFRNDFPSSQGNPIEEKAELPVKEILFKYVLSNKFIWILSISYFFVYVSRTALSDWSMLYLVEAKGHSTLSAGMCVCWFEGGGFLGSLVAGWASDTLFQARRNPINVLFSLGLLATLGLFWWIQSSILLIDSLFQFAFGFFVFGPQMLVGMAVAELAHKKSAATATGFAGCFAYLGAAVAGGPLGALIKNGGWDYLFLALMSCAMIAAFLLAPLWLMEARLQKETAKTNSLLENQ